MRPAQTAESVLNGVYRLTDVMACGLFLLIIPILAAGFVAVIIVQRTLAESYRFTIKPFVCRFRHKSHHTLTQIEYGAGM